MSGFGFGAGSGFFFLVPGMPTPLERRFFFAGLPHGIGKLVHGTQAPSLQTCPVQSPCTAIVATQELAIPTHKAAHRHTRHASAEPTIATAAQAAQNQRSPTGSKANAVWARKTEIAMPVSPEPLACAPSNLIAVPGRA